MSWRTRRRRGGCWARPARRRTCRPTTTPPSGCGPCAPRPWPNQDRVRALPDLPPYYGPSFWVRAWPAARRGRPACCAGGLRRRGRAHAWPRCACRLAPPLRWGGRLSRLCGSGSGHGSEWTQVLLSAARCGSIGLACCMPPMHAASSPLAAHHDPAIRCVTRVGRPDVAYMGRAQKEGLQKGGRSGGAP